MSERRFWRKMIYGCDSGDPSHELVFVLEDGCEGPRDESIPTVIQSGPFHWHFRVAALETASGRVVLPVPYVAGRCPTCARAGGCRTSLAGRFTLDPEAAPRCGDHRLGRLGLALCSISHTRWNEDQELVPMAVSDGPPESPAFLYPSPEEQDSMDRSHGQVCGIPVYEGRR